MAWLFYILQSSEAFFAGSDLYDVEDVIDEDLAVAYVACVKNLLCSVDDCLYGYFGYDDIDLDLRKQGCFDRYASVVFLTSLLYAAA